MDYLGWTDFRKPRHSVLKDENEIMFPAQQQVTWTCGMWALEDSVY